MSDKPLSIFEPEGAERDERAVQQIVNCLEHPSAVSAALMADHHLGYAMPIGGVVAYEDAISPTGVGFDIACGNMAVKTDLHLNDFSDDFAGRVILVKGIMREIQRRIDFGMGGTRSRSAGWVDHALFDDPVWSEIDKYFGPDLKKKARAQLGTVGSGNHYVDLLHDQDGMIWVANHFGSRGLGHTICSGFMAKAAGKDFTERVKESDDPVVFPTKEALGTFYVAAMRLAGEYAYAGREFVIETVLKSLGATATWTVHNHHNFAWFEDGLWVVRKGATPLTNAPAFIGGSMGDISVIVRGKTAGGPHLRWCRTEDIGALGSAPHGAGRVMSRTAAAGKLRKMWTCPNRNCDFVGERCTEGQSGHPGNKCPKCNIPLKRARVRDTTDARIDWDATRKDLAQRGIVVLGAGADEAPGVYKPLGLVLAAHPNIEVMNYLQPMGVVMAGPDVYDPYKD